MNSKLWPLAISLVLVLALNLQVEGSKSSSNPSYACRSSILSSLLDVYNTTRSLERFLLDSTATNRTKRSTFFTKPETCKVAFATLQTMHREIDASLKAAEAQSASLHCSTQNSNTDCKSVLKLIRCGVKHLRAAYFTSDSVSTPETQAKWENVITVMAAEYEKIIGNLKEELDQKRLREVDTLTLKLQNVKKTLACMEQFVSKQTRDSVADKILLGEFEIANSLIKDMGINGTGFIAIITKAYNKKPDGPPISSSKKVVNAEKILDFLDQSDGKPRMGVHGMHRLLQEIKTSGLWPNAFPKFKRLLRKFKESLNCLPSDAQIRLYSLHHDLEKALPKYIGSVVDLIHAHNPSGALNFYKTNISPSHEPESLKSIITDAYNRPRNGSKAANADTIMEFIEKLSETAEVEDGLNFLYGEMIINNDYSNFSVLRLKALYLARRLSNPDLKLKLEVGVEKAFSGLSKMGKTECGKLKALADKYPDAFDAYQVIRTVFSRGPSPRALEIGNCIDQLSSLLHKTTGYEALVEKMDELNLIDTYTYMEAVFRYKKHSSDAIKDQIYPIDRFNRTIENLPHNIRNFFFRSGVCQIISSVRHQCLATTGEWYWGLSDQTHKRYDTSYQNIGHIGCRWTFKKAGMAEWGIISAYREGSYLYASRGPYSLCPYFEEFQSTTKCRRTFVWANKGVIYNGHFKIKPFNGASKFAIINSSFTAVLFTLGDEVYNFELSSLDEVPAHERDFWYFECEK